MSVTEFNLTMPGWRQNAKNNSSVRGTAFVEGKKLTSDALSFTLPDADQPIAQWQTALRELNGFFAITKQSEAATIVAVDRIRSMPVFYVQREDTVYVSDDAEWLRTKLGNEQMNPAAKEEFQLAGYVTGQETLYPDLKQLQAGELLHIEHGDEPVFTTHRWYRYLHDEPESWDVDKLEKQLDQCAEDSIRRLAEYANGRQIVIPLSGGYDSRLIALLLKRIGYDNIFTFTYGVPGNKESRYSKKVADALGLKWHFVEYSKEKWRAAWQTEERRNYQRWGSGWASLPHMQDWLAVREMKAQGVIDPDAIFAPGHSGDFVAGSHIPSHFKPGAKLAERDLTQAIMHKHLSLAPTNLITNRPASFWNNRILDRCETVGDGASGLANAFEKWDWQERQAKIIVNSMRVYEFYGYDWWLPQWEPGFMEFWQAIPLELRLGAAWYTAYVKQAFIGQAGQVSIAHNNDNYLMNLIALMKRWLPNNVRIVMKKAAGIRSGAWRSHASLDRFPKRKTLELVNAGYLHNGVNAQFFLGEFSVEKQSDRH